MTNKYLKRIYPKFAPKDNGRLYPTTNEGFYKYYFDVYDVLRAFEVACPATQHAIKKLLMAGKRGHKDTMQDLKEARASIDRAIEIVEAERSEDD